MKLLRRHCPFCELYVRPWQRKQHEEWHAGQVVEITKLLCAHCFQEHRRAHIACDKYPQCRCSCNAWSKMGDE